MLKNRSGMRYALFLYVSFERTELVIALDGLTFEDELPYRSVKPCIVQYSYSAFVAVSQPRTNAKP